MRNAVAQSVRSKLLHSLQRLFPISSPTEKPKQFDAVGFGIELEDRFRPDAWGASAMHGTLENAAQERRAVELVTGVALTVQLKHLFDEGWQLIGITPPQSQQALQLDGLAECFRDGKPIPVPGEMGRRDMVIIEAIYRSAARGGERVEIKV